MAGMSALRSLPATGMETPCVQVCVLAPGDGPCLGCGRTLDEIAGWTTYTAERRLEIMATLPARLATLRTERKAGKERRT